MRKILHRARGTIAATLFFTVSAGVSAEDTSPPLPEVKWVSAQSVFPRSELRQKHEGTVAVEFSIDANGIPRTITVTKPVSRAFDSGAKRAIKNARFVVTEAWIAAGGPAARYHTSVVFDVAPCSNPPPSSPSETVVYVCGHQIRQ